MPKDLRRLLLFFLIVGIPCGGFFLWRWLDDRAAEKGWAEYVSAARSRGVKLTAEEFFIDPHLADAENYAASPLWDRAFAAGSDSDSIVPKLPPKSKSKASKAPRGGIDLAELRGRMADANWITAEQAGLNDAEAVLAGLERYRPFFDELRSLRPRGRAWYPVNWLRNYGAPFPHLSVIQNLQMALAAKARAELQLGRAKEAFETLRDAFQLAASLDSAPTLITTMVSSGIDFSMLHVIHAGIIRGAWTNEHLEAFQELLASSSGLRRAKAALEGERALFNSAIGSVAAELIGKLYVRKEDVEALAFPEWAATGRARWWRGNQQWANQAFDEELAALDTETGTWKRPAHRSFDVEQLGESERGRLQLATLVLSPMSILQQQAVFAHAVKQMGVIACALERHKRSQGEYPDNLQALQPGYCERLPLDPTTGNSFHYRREGETFLLYSAGLNGIDNGGDDDVFKEPRDEVARLLDWAWPH